MRLVSNSLPEDIFLRHAILRDYFCDKDASAVRTSDGWCLTLSWPGDADRHVDPDLSLGLELWGSIRRDQMAGAYCRDGMLMRCLYDSWTLMSWISWANRTTAKALESVVILHVDDHRDLGSPRLAADDTRWRDMITGQECNLRDPASVAASIESGAIGMGSFMAPFLAVAPRAEVRHLCQPPKAQRTDQFTIRQVTSPDSLLEPGAPRMGVELESVINSGGPGHYRMTPSIDDWLEGIEGRPILLHIDMDYFCNRYDGDSDWTSRTQRLDPPPEIIERRIDELIEALSAPTVAQLIQDVVIAFSPGFFPAEYWRRADERLTRGLKLNGKDTI